MAERIHFSTWYLRDRVGHAGHPKWLDDSNLPTRGKIVRYYPGAVGAAKPAHVALKARRDGVKLRYDHRRRITGSGSPDLALRGVLLV
jgi:hypothetical protein